MKKAKVRDSLPVGDTKQGSRDGVRFGPWMEKQTLKISQKRNAGKTD